MKTKTTLLATSALLALCLTIPAQAGDFYVTVMGGVNWLDDNSFSNTTAGGSDTLAVSGDADTGYIIGGAVGMDLHLAMQGLRVELEGALRHNQVDGVYSSSTGGGGSAGSISYDHRTFSILANAWYDWALGGGTVYAGGGIGWADVEVEGRFGGSTPFSISDSGFAWQLGAGYKFDVSQNVKIGVGYRYLQAPEVSLTAPFAGNSATGDLDTDTHSVVATVDVRI